MTDARSAAALRFYKVSIIINRPTAQDSPIDYDEVKEALELCLPMDKHCIRPERYELGSYDTTIGLLYNFALPLLPTLNSPFSHPSESGCSKGRLDDNHLRAH